ncbi:MAG: radical SAM protein [Candidatus Omnitrophota bacterium]
MASVLIASGLSQPRIIDEQLDPLDDDKLKALMASMKEPRIVGLSVLTINSGRAYEIAEMVKRIDPKAVVVLGGIHPTVLPEEALSHDGVDVVVRGEGEKTFEELVRLVMSGKRYNEIQGISFRGEDKITHTPDRPMIDNLDEVPPFPYHLFEKDRDKYPSFGGVFTSRGCPYKCTFCSSRSISGIKYRYFSIERSIHEIKLLIEKYGQKTIWLMDDNIAANKGHFISLLDAIMKEGLHEKACFHGSMRGDNISDEILDKAKAANFKMISFGLETGSESLMKIINKGETVEDVANAIRMTDKKGIAAATTVIFGLPTETKKDRRDAIKLAKSLPLSSIRFNILTPYPGTPVFAKLQAENKLFIKKNWGNFAVQYMWEGDDLPYVTDGTNVYELMFDTMFANLSFYLSFSGIKRMLKSSFAGGNVITLDCKWYSLPGMAYKLLRVFFYLSRRFIYVTYKMLTVKK